MQDRMKPFGGIRRMMKTKHSIKLEVLEEEKPTKFWLFSCWMVKFEKLQGSCLSLYPTALGLGNLHP